MDWNNKEDVLKEIKRNGFRLNYVSEELKDDPEIVIEALKRDGYSLNFIKSR